MPNNNLEANNCKSKTDYDSHPQTFRQTAESWLTSISGQVASTTFDRYQDTLERDIYPEYADTPMEDMTIAEMNDFLEHAPELAKARGRTLKKSSLRVIRAVLGGVIQFAGGNLHEERLVVISRESISYEGLSLEEMRKVILKAKECHSPEMLAALLSLYCGMRIGEVCALNCDDVDMARSEIYIHRIAHRIKNPDKSSKIKTAVVVEDIPRKNQIRTVIFPEILGGYIEEFMSPGRQLLRNRDGLFLDMRTLHNRIGNIMREIGSENINFERLRKTYMEGRADADILTDIFMGKSPDRPYEGMLDSRWLADEMARDLLPLRLLIGLSADEMGAVLGVSGEVYRSMETGRREISWDQYMALLFLFHYNSRTMNIVDSLGLFPEALKEKLNGR